MHATQPLTLLEHLERFADVGLSVRAELDHITMTMAQVMELDVGKVIQLSRPTGENIDIYVEGVLLGWGEVLLMDGAMAVRLADLRHGRFPDIDEDKASPEVRGKEQ